MPLTLSQQSRLHYQFNTLFEITNAIDAEKLYKEINPGKWSIWQNAVHLISYQPTFMQRIQKIVTEESPSFERYVAENDSLFYEYSGFTCEQVFNEGFTTRKNITDFIAGLTENDLNKFGIHLRYGKLSLQQWIEFFLLHEAHHLFTIFMLAHQTQ